jgi:glycosyltransferase involved in cell wall biosynthesis
MHRFLSDYHDIAGYYHALDLYFITSRSEGGPKALLESWASGVPVVSTRVGMPADLVRHAANGMLTEIDDVKSLTNYAMNLIEDTALWERCRCQALEEVKQYDWPLIAEQYYQRLYRPIMG